MERTPSRQVANNTAIRSLWILSFVRPVFGSSTLRPSAGVSILHRIGARQEGIALRNREAWIET